MGLIEVQRGFAAVRPDRGLAPLAFVEADAVLLLAKFVSGTGQLQGSR